jgi:hypothetical protein
MLLIALESVDIGVSRLALLFIIETINTAMRLYEFTGKTIQEMLAEIDRRGFLKGLGAAAATAAVPSMAKAAPFSHGEYKDQMSGEKQGKFAKVKADNGNATLEVEYDSKQPKVIIDVPRAIINFRQDTSPARIKLGNNPVENTYLYQGTSNSYSWGAITDKDLVNRILSHSGELKFEVNLYKDGPKVFVFTIEQDSTTKKFSQDNRSQIGKDREEKVNLNRSIEISNKKMEVVDHIKSELSSRKLGEDFPEGLEVKFTIDKAGNIDNFSHKFRGFIRSELVPKYANPEFFQKILPKKLPDVFYKGDTAELEIVTMSRGVVILTVK